MHQPAASSRFKQLCKRVLVLGFSSNATALVPAVSAIVRNRQPCLSLLDHCCSTQIVFLPRHKTGVEPRLNVDELPAAWWSRCKACMGRILTIVKEAYNSPLVQESTLMCSFSVRVLFAWIRVLHFGVLFICRVVLGVQGLWFAFLGFCSIGCDL